LCWAGPRVSLVRMKPGRKNLLMRVSNLLLYLSFCGMVGTGLMLEYRLVPGSEGGHGLSVLGLTRHEWGEVHFWLGLIMAVTVVAHLALNWKWLAKIAAGRRRGLLWAGLGTGAAIIAVFLLLPVEVDAEAGEARGGGYGAQGGGGGHGRGAGPGGGP